jgi:hypothetical protein
VLNTDYLVVGAGAMGMAFVDSLIAHSDARITIVDDRTRPGGHWVDAYPFVRLHQASQFYGVASTQLGTGSLQTEGPEAGLHERATQPEVLAYYDALMRRFVDSGRVAFLGGHRYRREGAEHVVTSLATGETFRITPRRPVVDATFIAPRIPATSPPPFAVGDDAWVVPVNEVPLVAGDASEFVIVGSGKTATDAIVWLVGSGIDASRIAWVRPREPWMLNRAAIQPNPISGLTFAANLMESAAAAATLDDMFLRLEDAGVVLRLDRSLTPTMARTPTLATWELELLRTVERVVRMGHIVGVTGSELTLNDGSLPLAPGTVVVHCAGAGLKDFEPVPIWQPDAIRLQPIRAGAPCFAAALAGYVEATRDDDRERNRLCPSNAYSNSLASWARMHAGGVLGTRAYTSEPDVAAWANACLLNAGRIPAELRDTTEVTAASARLARAAEAGLARLMQFSGHH